MRNKDLSNFPEGIGSYSKGLKHNGAGPNIGFVDPASFAQFLKACAIDPTSTTTPYAGPGVRDFENLGIVLGDPLGKGSRLNGPQGAFAGNIGGKPSNAFVSAPAPELDSPEYWVELIECYWASLLRDVPFGEYPTNATAIAAANELTNFAAHYAGPVDGSGKVIPSLLFRGGFGKKTKEFMGERDGPYLSQLCLQPCMLGALTIDQKIKTLAPGIDFVTTLGDWLQVQQGLPTGAPLTYDSMRRFMRTGRDTAAYTHTDELYQAYLIAFLACAAVGITPDPNMKSPYFSLHHQKPFGTFGGPDITGVIGAVARAAINAVWYQKWSIHLRHRPEYGGGLVELWQENKLNPVTKAKFANISMILNSTALNLSHLRNGSYLLSQTFPEASPTHPAYPTGHGVVAGACITALKFFLDGDATIANPVEPTADGLTLQPYSGPALSLNGELHKLAHNVSFGHGIHAGIHWRSDTDASLLLGEEVAIAVLADLAKTYNETFVIDITKMDGTKHKFHHP